MLVPAFYKQVFWDQFKGDAINNQDIANELFDTSVNMGTTTTIKFMQHALNILSKNGSLYMSIEEDGKFGQGTLNAVNAFSDTKDLYKVLNILQGHHYIEICEKNPEQEKFMYGWLNRVDFIKQ